MGQSLLLPVKDTTKSKCYERSNLRALNSVCLFIGKTCLSPRTAFFKGLVSE